MIERHLRRKSFPGKKQYQEFSLRKCVETEAQTLLTLRCRYFNTSRFTSFTRQVSLYQFTRVRDGPDKGAFYHELFLRGRPDLVAQVHRPARKPVGHRPSGYRHPDPTPSFNVYPTCVRLSVEEVKELYQKGIAIAEVSGPHRISESPVPSSSAGELIKSAVVCGGHTKQHHQQHTSTRVDANRVEEWLGPIRRFSFSNHVGEIGHLNSADGRYHIAGRNNQGLMYFRA